MTMIVQWTEFDYYGYKLACDLYPENARIQDYEKSFKGEVIDKYRTFWGTPKFIVALRDGSIVSIQMTKCTIVRRLDGEKTA